MYIIIHVHMTRHRVCSLYTCIHVYMCSSQGWEPRCPIGLCLLVLFVCGVLVLVFLFLYDYISYVVCYTQCHVHVVHCISCTCTCTCICTVYMYVYMKTHCHGGARQYMYMYMYMHTYLTYISIDKSKQCRFSCSIWAN